MRRRAPTPSRRRGGPCAGRRRARRRTRCRGGAGRPARSVHGRAAGRIAVDEQRTAVAAAATRPHLAQQARAEHPQVVGVATDQATRLAERAVHPLEARLAASTSGPAASSPVRKSSVPPMPMHDRRADGGAVAGDPALLLRVAERDADHVGVERPQLVDDSRRPSTRRRRPSAPARRPRRRRVPFAQDVGGAVGDARGAAEQAQPPRRPGPPDERAPARGRRPAVRSRIGARSSRAAQTIAHAVGDRQVGRRA